MNRAAECRQGPGGRKARDATDPKPDPSLAPGNRFAATRLALAAWLRLPLAQHARIIFICAIVGSLFVHEVGHCAVAWAYGLGAIPTPAKEYLLHPALPAVQEQIALGGILGSLAAVLFATALLHGDPSTARSAVFGGALTGPGFYTLRFLLAGRGHDATEFQEAQAALGLSYAGHAVDWLFAGLFAAAVVFWFWRAGLRRLNARLAGRLIGGTLLALVVLMALQTVNNALFDPLFER